jgi:hypothetical protein
MLSVLTTRPQSRVFGKEALKSEYKGAGIGGISYC